MPIVHYASNLYSIIKAARLPNRTRKGLLKKLISNTKSVLNYEKKVLLNPNPSLELYKNSSEQVGSMRRSLSLEHLHDPKGPKDPIIGYLGFG